MIQLSLTERRICPVYSFLAPLGLFMNSISSDSQTPVRVKSPGTTGTSPPPLLHAQRAKRSKPPPQKQNKIRDSFHDFPHRHSTTSTGHEQAKHEENGEKKAAQPEPYRLVHLTRMVFVQAFAALRFASSVSSMSASSLGRCFPNFG